MKPEEGVKRRGLERRHVAAAPDAVVDRVVNVLEATVSAVVGAVVPAVEAEGVEFLVGEQQEADIASEGGKFVGEDGADARVLGAAAAVGVTNCSRVAGPLFFCKLIDQKGE